MLGIGRAKASVPGACVAMADGEEASIGYTLAAPLHGPMGSLALCDPEGFDRLQRGDEFG